MATKWKKSKTFKFFLVFFMVVMSFVFAFSCVQGIVFIDRIMYISSPEAVVDLWTNGKPDFFDCPAFQNEALNEIARVNVLFNDAEQYRKNLETGKTEAVDEIVKLYSINKAGIIKKELEYIAQNYKRQEYDGVSIYNENGYSEILDAQIPEVPYSEQKYIVDPYASKTVQMVQKILNYAEGEEFLKYASLVRYESFNESEFYCDTKLGYQYHQYNYTATVENIKADAERGLTDFIESEYQMYKSDLAQSQMLVNGYENLKYYVKKSGKVFTNMESPEAALDSAKKREFYLVKENGKMLYNSGSNLSENQWMFESYDYDSRFKSFDEAVFYIDSKIVVDGSDDIGELYKGYQSLPVRFDLVVITVVASLVLLLACVALILMSAGHKNGVDGCVTVGVDKFPPDVHLVLSGGLITGLYCMAVIIFDMWYDNFNRLFAVLLSVCCTVAFLLLVEFIASMARTKKAKKKIFRNCIIVKLIIFIFKGIAKFVKWCVRGVRKAFFSYKMKHLSKKFILLAVLWVIINVAGMFFAVVGAFNDGVTTVIAGLLLLIFDGATIFIVAKYLNTLDKIIVASTEHTSANLYGERLPKSLTTLNESLKVTREEMDEAVAKAVKNERTKAELITNVSHDLKTPLTSVISYVDLLKKCNIEDEDALKYIDVLSDKSLNLKNLIENLIEASKASTGNIKINKVYLNLKELAAQATGEFQSDFEARDLELRFAENCEDVRVFVDGPHTYRVLENLLSNAKKYSAKGTRVYASIRREGNFGVFELKNISKDPLDISPEELTERFVRGDASRGSEEGNGLGLSIAKQLCTLQGGELKLTIDGDLFKATVYLPIS